MSLALIAILVTIGLFVLAQTLVAVFWGGRHAERSNAHADRIKQLEERQDAAREAAQARADQSRAALREEVKSALEGWQEGRGEKIAELTSDVEKLGERIERGFTELRELVASVSSEMTSQHHRLRAVERHAGIQPSEPRLSAIDPRREPHR